MPQYVIERDIPGAGKMSPEQVREASLKSVEVVESLGPGIRWIVSYVTDDKIYCIYFAPDEALIREHASRLGVPVSRVEAVRQLMNPELARPHAAGAAVFND